MKFLPIILALFASAVSAADISGTWKGSAETSNGTFERTFVFKQSGSALTGETTSSMFGKSAIADGKVEGDNVSFAIVVKFEGNDVKLTYKGQLAGSELKLHVDGPNGISADYVVKRTS